MISLPALLLTAAWVVLVGVILALFGRTAGGAWSIAGGVARGVRDWAGGHREPRSRATSSPWSDVASSSSAPSASSLSVASPASDAYAPGAAAELEDFGDRPAG